MLIAKIQDGQVLDVADHTVLLPDTSFGFGGPTLAQIEEMGFMQVTVWRPHDQATEKLVPCAPSIENGQVYTVAVEPLTADELKARVDAQWAAVRAQRNQLLASSDWTQLSDAPVDKAKWATYRQALRDITSQTVFPDAVEWPTIPGTQTQQP